MYSNESGRRSNPEGIDDQGIKDLFQLEELHVDSNKKITNINHLTKLKKLSANYESAIDEQGIKDLFQLEELNVLEIKKLQISII